MITVNARYTEDENGFTTTFPMDMNIAVRFSKDAVMDTHKRIMKDWGDDVDMMIHYVFTLNTLCWLYYEKGFNDVSELFSNLYYKAHHECLSSFKGDDLTKYFNATD